ncbi:response regulator transcription factor [Ornithinibacter aureus]|uniref:Response regulator transcription factor n=1 Tax=Ornithinibacter aureus TaxID=622664 RepID=A0ABP8K5W8_9MICO|nr:response regulator transcription factor [Ornithinibacter aureus]KAF0835486.1 LuxR family two component transcriptional regulator [Ornithinibacter aureus]
MQSVSPGTVTRVVIADDHAQYRRGMQIVVELEGTARVVGEASNGDEALAVCTRLRPDIVLMDVRMPGVGGIEACRRIRWAVPETRIIMLTMSDEEDDLFEAIKAGASGYLLKGVPGEEVLAAIGRVGEGQAIIPASMAAILLTEFARLSRNPEPFQRTLPPLTDREVEVLRLVARGQANREIAEGLVISENTVKNHVRNILEKLHLHSRVEAAVYAHQQHLIPTDE